MRSSSSWTSSSQNGLIQMFCLNASTGCSLNQPAILLAVAFSLPNRPRRKPDPFSTDATRRFGKRTNSWSQTSDARKSSMARSSCVNLMGWGMPPLKLDENPSFA